MKFPNFDDFEQMVKVYGDQIKKIQEKNVLKSIILIFQIIQGIDDRIQSFI